MNTNIGNVDITMRNDIVANTDMQTPFFIIELSNIVLEDNENLLREAVDTGRELEFSYNGQHFFESRNNDNDWYIYCEETKETQHFSSAQELIETYILQGKNINELWEQISLECIL